MGEINNNVEIGKQIPQAPIKADASKTEPQIPQKGDDDGGKEKVVKDFSNEPAEALGRSQVQNVNPVDKDVAFGVKNAKKIESANNIFEIAYKQAMTEGMTEEQAYQKAANIMDAYVKEFS